MDQNEWYDRTVTRIKAKRVKEEIAYLKLRRRKALAILLLGAVPLLNVEPYFFYLYTGPIHWTFFLRHTCTVFGLIIGFMKGLELISIHFDLGETERKLNRIELKLKEKQ